MNMNSFAFKKAAAVADQCYDCAAFYDGCGAWPASDKFACRDYQQLPDVKAGPTDWRAWVYGGARMPAYPDGPTTANHGDSATTGQTFPKKVFVPGPQRLAKTWHAARDKATKATTAHTLPVASPGHLNRRCECGRPLPKRRRYCDVCREARKRDAIARFKERYPSRRHRRKSEGEKVTRMAQEASECPTMGGQ